jgi:hypothetical protein
LCASACLRVKDFKDCIKNLQDRSTDTQNCITEFFEKKSKKRKSGNDDDDKKSSDQNNNDNDEDDDDSKSPRKNAAV